MSLITLKQPDGKYAIYSTESDVLVAIDLTREQVLRSAARRAARRAREETEMILKGLDGDPEFKAFCSEMDFEEALDAHWRYEGNIPNDELNTLIRQRFGPKPDLAEEE